MKQTFPNALIPLPSQHLNMVMGKNMGISEVCRGFSPTGSLWKESQTDLFISQSQFFLIQPCESLGLLSQGKFYITVQPIKCWSNMRKKAADLTRLKALLLFPIIPDGKEHAAGRKHMMKKNFPKMRGLIHKKSEAKMRHKLSSIPEISVKDHHFFAASVKKPQMWNTALAKQVLSFVLHSRTPGLNQQALECEWTAQHTGSDSHPWCVPLTAVEFCQGLI